LYTALQSTDATDSILNRVTVVLLNTLMECKTRLAHTIDPKTVDIYLRHFEKITRTLIDAIEARERRRRPKQVKVGKVNVEAGGQAIVGNVQNPSRRRAEAETPRSHTSRNEDADE
jgi:hypothetical protein